MIQFIIFILIGYLMGSICSAIIVCRMANLPDPRQEGSKNPGATNVLRLGGKQYAAAVVAGDMLKGLIPVMLANLFNASIITVGFTALAAVVGHIYPVFFEFKGGKGVATSIGAMFGINLFLGIIVSAIWLLVANFSGYASLASMVAIALSSLIAIPLTGNISIFPPLLFITILVVYKHRNNITRLMDGTEPKISFKHGFIKDAIEPAPAHDHKETASPAAELKPASEAVEKPKRAAAKPKPAAPKEKKPAKAKETATKTPKEKPESK